MLCTEVMCFLHLRAGEGRWHQSRHEGSPGAPPAVLLTVFATGPFSWSMNTHTPLPHHELSFDSVPLQAGTPTSSSDDDDIPLQQLVQQSKSADTTLLPSLPYGPQHASCSMEQQPAAARKAQHTCSDSKHGGAQHGMSMIPVSKGLGSNAGAAIPARTSRDADDRNGGGSADPAANVPSGVRSDSSQHSMDSMPVAAAQTPCGQEMSSGPRSSEGQGRRVDSSQAAGAGGRTAVGMGGQVHAQAEREDAAAPVNMLANGLAAASAEEPPGLQLRALPGGGQPLEGCAEIGEDYVQPQLISDRCATLYILRISGHDILSVCGEHSCRLANLPGRKYLASAFSC